MVDTIAALYVATGGVYFGLPHVDPWDETRDARKYAGPHRVVAHPPCERWGRYWGGGPMLHGTSKQKKLGDDAGCFTSALTAVEKFGGVLEHPEASHAWRHFGIAAPPKSGGWIPARRGWTCCVEQGHYGHRARKATWLYCVSTRKPLALIWGPSEGKTRLDAGFHNREERANASQTERLVARLSAKERIDTPLPFRVLLLRLARRG